MKHAAKRQEWQERIVECRSSGKSVKEWCKEQGTTTATYYRWEREILGGFERKDSGRRLLAESTPEFAAVPEITTSGRSGQAIMTVRKGEIAVEIYVGAGEREIEAVCRALKQC